MSDLDIKNWLEQRENFDLIIDARSPHEFLYSHIKNSKNFYALNDTQHQQTGTLYKQSRADAKILGAKFACENIAKHLEEIQKIAKVGSLVGIYCARGGMRSASIAQVLSMIGYRILRLSGGYKAYRTHVQNELEKPVKLKFITLFGNTGSYKTKLINELSPSLNLEKIANHLGSVFGAINGTQPSQKAFEDELFEQISDITKHHNLCFIEGESRRIGMLTLPKSIYEAMRSGVNIEIKASLSKRVECTMSDYKMVDDDFFYDCIRKISPFISAEVKADVCDAYEKSDTSKVCELLLTKYYDKVYKKQERIDYVVCSDDIENAKDKLIEIFKKHDTKTHNF
ncbi:tRNA 2-selenouridine(34) synthase MnmH [Campylobacter mucosalis]|uniref:tRNA 2-selenouridine synthase n=1 Tax=Campylobacter mucosalis CCUG 21559 TaxID=1032067 RepID=A0A6G5QHI7_9BACT|nr:tRNA 2-selenouridine(34) synthase MnmH [Campylobacter mucosalis]QCD45130.1 tRNA 2-selenouridine synthase [Campylobacter mucosalis CCUG 21559]